MVPCNWAVGITRESEIFLEDINLCQFIYSQLEINEYSEKQQQN